MWKSGQGLGEDRFLLRRAGTAARDERIAIPGDVFMNAYRNTNFTQIIFIYVSAGFLSFHVDYELFKGG